MKKPAIKYPFAFAVGYVAVKLITAYIIPPIFCTMLASLGSFLFGFYYLQKLKKHFGKIIWLMPVVVILRIVFKFLLDDTPLYNEVLVDLCHKIFAVTIIAVVYAMAKRLYKKKCCVSMAEKMSGYTYEFYLVHSPIINGPVALPFGTNFIALGIVGFVVSTLAAWLLHYILTVLNKIIERK